MKSDFSFYDTAKVYLIMSCTFADANMMALFHETHWKRHRWKKPIYCKTK